MTTSPPSTRATAGLGIVLLVAFVGLAAVVTAGWTGDLDARGRAASGWALSHGLGPALRFVEVALDQSVVSVCALVLAVALLVGRRPREAAGLGVAVVGTAFVTTAAKAVVGRDRPPWQWSSYELTSGAYPSGHASSVTALAGAVLLTALVLVREGRLGRVAVRVVVAGCVALVVLVSADRVLLGRHFPTDVIGGVLLGAAMVCLTSAGLSALPRSTAPGARRSPSD